MPNIARLDHPDCDNPIDLTDYVNRLVASDEFVSDSFWPNNWQAVCELIREHMPDQLRVHAQKSLDSAMMHAPRRTSDMDAAEDHCHLYEQYDLTKKFAALLYGEPQN